MIANGWQNLGQITGNVQTERAAAARPSSAEAAGP